jgi:hypothetical protein
MDSVMDFFWFFLGILLVAFNLYVLKQWSRQDD